MPPTQLLLDEIIRVKPREMSGSMSSNRADYQKSWAFCLLLKLHRAADDYLVLLDFHDDVAVLNSSVDPTAIDFYQVKTKKSGNWTLTLLLKRDKAEPEGLLPSIAGKMFANKLAFPGHTRSVNFVSNARFSVRLKATRSETVVDGFELAQLWDEGLQDFTRAIQEEHGVDCSSISKIITRFTTDPLSMEGHTEHALGQFARFLEDVKGGGKYAVGAGFRAITTTLARKTNNERRPGTKEELVTSKGICRTEFESMLKTIVSHEEDKERWQEIRQTLTAENQPYGDIARWQSAWKKYAVQRMDASNAVLMAVQKLVRSAIEASKKANPSQTLSQLIADCLKRFQAQIPATQIPYDRDYLTAVILFEASED